MDADSVQAHWEGDQTFPTHLWLSKTVCWINHGGMEGNGRKINNHKCPLGASEGGV